MFWKVRKWSNMELPTCSWWPWSLGSLCIGSLLLNQSQCRQSWSWASSKSNLAALSTLLSMFNLLFFWLSVKFSEKGGLGWASAKPEGGWGAQETPSANFLFCIVAEKGRTFNSSGLSFLSSKPMGQFTSTDMWVSCFVLHVSHMCRSGQCLLLLLLSFSSAV